MPKPAPRRAYSYLRFSTPEQAAGDSFRRQHSMAVEYAARHGLALDEHLVFHDKGVSAFHGRNVEAGRLADFLDCVEAGEVPQGSVLLVEALDRISRLNAWDAVEVLRGIMRRGVSVVTLNDGKVYDEASARGDATSLLLAVMLFMRGNEESETKGRRGRAAWVGKRQRASTRPLTAMTPGWLRVVPGASRPEVIPERAEVVCRIFRDHLAGVGTHAIAAALNAEGVEPWGTGRRKGTKWHRSYVLKILASPATYGTFVPHTRQHEAGKRVTTALEPLVDYFPAVVSREDFDAVQRLRSGPAPKLRGGAVASLLAGLARCPVCLNPMTRVNKGAGPKGGRPKLVCTVAKVGGECLYRGVDQAEAEAGLLADPSRLVAEAPSTSPALDAAYANAEAAVGGLEDAIGNVLDAIQRTGTSPALAARLRDLEGAHAEAVQRRDGLAAEVAVTSSPVIGKRLRDLEEALEGGETTGPGPANVALRSMLSGVVVDYEWGLLRLQWKHGGESEVRYAWPRAETLLSRRPSAA